MAQIHSIGRYFVVYGVNDRDRLIAFKRDWVVEDTEWKPDENHRDGRSYQLHIGRWFAGVGVFRPGLSEAMLEQIEEEAVWLDDVEPGDIGRWAGSREAGATRLGYEYKVRRAQADEAADEAAGDESYRAGAGR